jgi:hypothetical protein
MASSHRKATLHETTAIRRAESNSNPYAMVAGAFGIGFVLGGGLFTRLTARVANVAVRAALMAALPHLKDALIDAVDQTLRDESAPRAGTPKTATAKPVKREGTSP